MFRNAVAFRMKPEPTDAPLTVEGLREALSRRPLQAPGSQDLEMRGWTSPADDGDYVLSAGGLWLIQMGIEKKVLPSRAIQRLVAERAKKIEEERGHAPGRKELRDLKEEIIRELLPTALIQPSSVRAIIAPAQGYVIVDASSLNKAWEVMELLIETLEAFPVTRILTQAGPTRAMTNWLLEGDAPSGFSFENDVELRQDDGETSKVHYSGGEVDYDAIGHYIELLGMLPTRIGLTYRNSVSFILTNNLELKSICLLDLMEQRLSEEQGDGTDKRQRLESELSLVGFSLLGVLQELVGALGGEIEFEQEKTEPAQAA